MTTPSPRRRRYLRIGTAVILVLTIVLVLALPALLSTRVAKTVIVARINRVLAPGFLEVGSIRLTWFGPTRLEQVTLLDPREAVVATPSASMDRGLWHIVTGGMQGTTLTLDQATLDIERSANGSINLGRALVSLLAHPDPRREITIKIASGTLRFQDPGLTVPATADQVELTLRLPAAPNPITGTLKLGQKDAALEVGATFDRWNAQGGPSGQPEIRLEIRGHRWPFTARVGGADASGQLDGTLDLDRRLGFWHLDGDARLLDLMARGGPLRDETLNLGRIDAGWDLNQAADGWAIRRLGVSGPFGELKAEGTLEDRGRRKIEGRLDLAAIAAQIPRFLRLREGLTVERGTARLEIESTPSPSGSIWDVEARLIDLTARAGDRSLLLHDPATVNSHLVASQVERLTIKTAFLDASARGRIDEGVTLDGKLDLAALHRQMGEWVDFGRLDLAGVADLTGRFRSAGRSHEGQLKAAIRDLRVDGLTSSPIRRDAAVVEFAGQWNTNPDGSVLAPTQAKASVQSGEYSADLVVTPSRDESDRLGFQALNLVGNVVAPVRVGDQKTDGLAHLSGLWHFERQTLDLEPVSLDLSESETLGPLRLVGSGRYDHRAGTLTLRGVRNERVPSWLNLSTEGIHVSGIGQGLTQLHVSALLDGDLRRLSKPDATAPPRSFSAQFQWNGDGEAAQIAAKVSLDGGNEPTTARPSAASLRGRFDPGADRLDLTEMSLTSPYGVVDASGRLDEVSGNRRVDLSGTVAPDFAAITAWLTTHVEPRARISGKPRPFRVSGTLAGDALAGLEGNLGFALEGADVYGMELGPTAVVLQTHSGRWTIDPISTTLNQGHIRLEPELDLNAPGGATLRLGKNSTIRDAKINDEVSRRVLAYVAPVLEQATTASGFISVDLDHAEFPLTPGRAASTRVEGAVVFTDVEFAPGPLAEQLIRAAGRQETRIELNQPVTLTIADGRVNQRGLAIPIGGYTEVALEGWVAFDRRLALTATLPVTSAMLGENPFLADIAAGTRVTLPIGGTLDRPELDREALAAHLKELGKSLLTRGAARGAIEILKRLSQPRDPNAPPPEPRPTPEERKAKRLEKKAQRRGID